MSYGIRKGDRGSRETKEWKNNAETKNTGCNGEASSNFEWQRDSVERRRGGAQWAGTGVSMKCRKLLERQTVEPDI